MKVTPVNEIAPVSPVNCCCDSISVITGKGIGQTKVIKTGHVSTQSADIVVTIDEHLPLVSKEQCVTIDAVSARISH